jgi:hypothetical protein
MSRHRWEPVCRPPGRLVRPVPLDLDGLTGPTRGQAKGPKWRRTSHGWYVPADVDGDLPEQRIIEQSVRLPPGGAVTGWAALRLHGGGFFDGLAPDGRTPLRVPLAVGPKSKSRSDHLVRLSREPLPREEVVIRQGIPCTVVERALFDEMRRSWDLRAATVAMDMAAAALLVSVRRMRAYWLAHRGWRRASMIPSALDLASEDSRSPNESRTRLLWELDAGLPRPLVNQPVWDLHGKLLGIADLLDPHAGLVGEFDGADHRSAPRHTRDILRQERFERHLLEVFRVTGLDLLDPERVVARIRFHRSRSRWLPPDGRPWTIVPPESWEPELTLDEYLEERDFHREMHERLVGSHGGGTPPVGG